MAGVAVETTVFGYCPPEAGHNAPDALTKVGATCFFTDMGEPAALLGLDQNHVFGQMAEHRGHPPQVT